MIKYGTEEQKNKFLPKLATSWLGSFCISESSSGSDAFALKTKADDKGDHFILNGEKAWITNAKESSLFKCAKSNSALCIINFLSFIKFKKLTHTSKNFFWVARNSSLYP